MAHDVNALNHVRAYALKLPHVTADDFILKALFDARTNGIRKVRKRRATIHCFTENLTFLPPRNFICMEDRVLRHLLARVERILSITAHTTEFVKVLQVARPAIA